MSCASIASPESNVSLWCSFMWQSLQRRFINYVLKQGAKWSDSPFTAAEYITAQSTQGASCRPAAGTQSSEKTDKISSREKFGFVATRDCEGTARASLCHLRLVHKISALKVCCSFFEWAMSLQQRICLHSFCNICFADFFLSVLFISLGVGYTDRSVLFQIPIGVMGANL